MNLKKSMMILTLTAAIGSAGVFTSLAAVDVESIQVGWIEIDDKWYYLDQSGNRMTGWIDSEEGDGRGNRVRYYLDSNGVMLENTTRNIGGKDYTFGEDGSYLENTEYQGASRGSFSESTFTNGWSNIKVAFPAMYYSADNDELSDYVDYFVDDDFAAVGKPKLSYDFMVETSSGGDSLELYYADMSANQAMTPAAFAQAMAVIYNKTDYYAVKANAADVTVGGQTYTKIGLVDEMDRHKDLYCRKQDQYMVVLTATYEGANASSMDSLVNSITTAR